jgi:hypothetical protein
VEAPKVEDEEAMFNTTSEEDGMNAPIKGVVDGESEAAELGEWPVSRAFDYRWQSRAYPFATIL